MSNVQVDVAGAAALIRAAPRILFFLHVSPDGDSIGSSLAVCRAVRALGHEGWCVGVDPVPRIYRFLPGWDQLFVPWAQVQGDWDLAVLLDCGDRARVGDAEPLLARCRATLNIDHHRTNTGYGDYNWLDPGAAAVGEMAYKLIRALGAPLDRETALCLYTSIVTDTGQFKYESVTPETHRIAAALIEAGVRPYDVAQHIYENESPARTRLTALCLATLQLHGGGRIATLRVTREMLAQSGATDDEVDGLVNHARAVSGVEVGILCRELADGRVRVNLRSRGEVDVGELAKAFGGGGHARAAGLTAEGDLAAVEAAVVAAAAARLGQGPAPGGGGMPWTA